MLKWAWEGLVTLFGEGREKSKSKKQIIKMGNSETPFHLDGFKSKTDASREKALHFRKMEFSTVFEVVSSLAHVSLKAL